ncbi:MAG: phosphatidate cytidylyltransferase [Gemmatimonadales bacterium]
MSELTKRVTFAVIAIPVVIGLVWLGGAVLATLIAVGAMLASYEFYRLAIGAGSVPLWGHGVFFSALIPLLVHAHFLGLWTPPVSIVMLVVLELLTVALWVRGSTGKPLEVVGITLLGIFYTGGMFSFAYALRYQEYAVGANAGTALVALPMVLTWGTDSGAFFVGRAIGRRKLMPAVSPGKTVEGAIGGLLAAVLLSVLYGRYVLPPMAQLALPFWTALAFGALVSVAAQVGDLVESMLKRQAGVKDSSHLIPGHGGMLDRVDSLLFTLPVGFVLLGWMLVPAPR